jgi:Ras-related protein Rab-1A
MVYDCTSQESFDHVEEWLSEVDRYANENTSKLLVGNKADLIEQKQVSEEAAHKFAEKIGVSFLETSAKTSTNVDAAFLTMAKELIQAKEKAAANPGATNNKKPANNNNNNSGLSLDKPPAAAASSCGGCM